MVVPEGIQYQVQLITGLCGSARGHSIPSPDPGLGMPHSALKSKVIMSNISQHGPCYSRVVEVPIPSMAILFSYLDVGLLGFLETQETFGVLQSVLSIVAFPLTASRHWFAPSSCPELPGLGK